MSSERYKSLRNWEVVCRHPVTDFSPWFKLWREEVLLPDGNLIKIFYYLNQPSYVVVFRINANFEVLCLWHYKHGARRVCLGLPAGYIEDNEKPIDAAKRELWEETGCRSDNWQELGIFTVDGNRGGGQAHIYFAKNVSVHSESKPDDLEKLIIEWIEIGTLRKHLFSGKVATCPMELLWRFLSILF